MASKSQQCEPGAFHVAADQPQPRLNRARITEQVIGAVVIALVFGVGSYWTVVRDMQIEARHQREILNEIKTEVRKMRDDLYSPRGGYLFPPTSWLSQPFFWASLRSVTAEAPSIPAPELPDYPDLQLADFRHRLVVAQ